MSKGPSRVGNSSSFRNAVFPGISNSVRWTKSRIPSNSECHTPSLGPFRF
jgi:hypothetical protein